MRRRKKSTLRRIMLWFGVILFHLHIFSAGQVLASESDMPVKAAQGFENVAPAETDQGTEGEESENQNLTEYPIEESLHGIVAVQSGFFDQKGVFQRMKSGSGFLIRNTSENTYLVTCRSIVTNSAKEIKAFCKEREIKTKDQQYVNSIRIIVKGDVSVEAEILTQSEEQDYCVLTTASVINEKRALKMGDSDAVHRGDSVTALGFPDDIESIEFSDSDVEIKEGKLLQKEDGPNELFFFRHSAPVTRQNAGGPLLDECGYVIGLNYPQTEAEGGASCLALPINEIKEVLNNFAISYGSQTNDASYRQLADLIAECRELSAKGNYKKSSLEQLNQALQKAEEVIQQEEADEVVYTEAYRMLTAAKVRLVPKTEKITIAIWILAALIVLSAVWLLILLLKNAADRKKMQIEAQSDNRPVYEAVQRLQLVRKRTGEAIIVSHNPFVIGAGKEEADFYVTGNPAISRKHLRLWESGGAWFAVDLGSSNGTWKNGEKVEQGQAVKIGNGDELLLADETFTVQEF